MVKHIVMWKLREVAEGNTKIENAMKIKKDLEGLKTFIEEIVQIEVGLDFLKSEQSYDLVLYSVFKSREDLEKYQNHPEHKKVGEFIAKVREERVVADYEL